MVVLFAFFSILFSSISMEPVLSSYEAQLRAIVIKGLDVPEDVDIKKCIGVYFGEVDFPTNQPRVMGTYSKEGSNVLYRPKYGFSAGASYTVIINSDIYSEYSRDVDTPIHREIIHIPELNIVSSTYIKQVYPTASELPMNQLKLYLEFSAPMREGRAYDHIKLYNLSTGNLETEAFITMPEELWDPERKRLTIFFDPGRIKRGVQPNLQLGLPLVEDQLYRLVIKKEWPDSNGAMLIQDLEKEFLVVGVDRKSPAPELWNTTFPVANTVEVLSIDFKESMDYGLLHSAIVIVNEANQPISGQVSLADNEQKWFFTPEASWLPGNYKIIVDGWLEDLAGNNLRRKFDVDLNNPEDTPKNFKEVFIPFTIIKH